MPIIPEPRSAAAVLEEAQAELQAWCAAHPEATLYDMEVATERHLARVRAALVRELVTATDAGAVRPACPSCGEAMQRVGMQTRTVALPYDEPLTLQGPRFRCPACGAGVSPPR
jgi:predicted RNA-binding Zn-ribbon protein involved in translation (DUF1610 family)